MTDQPLDLGSDDVLENPVERPTEGISADAFPADASLVDGPWLSGFVLEVPLPLRSKSNFRRHQRTVGGVNGWSDQRRFEQSVGWFLRAGRPDSWSIGMATSKVSERPAVVVAIAARSTVDASNFSKSIVDAGEGVLYVSDASVLGVSSVGVRGRGTSTFVGFAQIPPGATPAQIQQALSELSGRVVERFDAAGSSASADS